MSRIGKQPVQVPAGVTVTVNGSTVTVKGGKGELTRTFSDLVKIEEEGEELHVVRVDESTASNAQQGLTRTLLHNMVVGVSEGFEKKLELTGVGYRATLKGKDLDLSLGYSHPVLYPAPDNITFEVPDNTHITVKGISKEQVGQVAAEIRCRSPWKAPARAVQGQGHSLRGRAHPQEARQGRQVASRLIKDRHPVRWRHV